MTALAKVEPQATLEELAEIANREHGHVHQLETQVNRLGTAMFEHAIRAGEALSEARSRCPDGEWLKWLADNFNATSYTAATYIRVAYHQSAVRDAGEATLSGAVAFLRDNGLQGPTRPGGKYQLGHPDDVREEARRLHDEEGCGARAISTRLGVSRETARRWVDPEYAKRKAEYHEQYRRVRKDEISARRKAKYDEEQRQQQAQRKANAHRAARKAGGGIAKAYSMAESMQGVLGQAHGEATDPEARRALALAGQHYRKMRDEIVRALGVS